MDDTVIRGLHAVTDPNAQTRTLQYFEHLKSSNDGWELCGDALVRGLYDDVNVKFCCFQVLEHHVRTRHSTSSVDKQVYMRKILMSWLQNQCHGEPREKSFLRNKAGQVFSLVFVSDYPHKWPTFFSDLLQTLQLGQAAVDLYLRIMKAINEEVVDREVVRTLQESERNTNIKDSMREQCVSDLVDSWYQILKTYEATDSSLTCLCLEVVGCYVNWVDISLIANEKFVSTLLQQLSVEDLRESVCDCFHEIIAKGMEPMAKMELVESLVNVLVQAGALPPADSEDADFLAKVAKLVNGIGYQLIASYNKLTKAGETALSLKALEAVEMKIPYLFRFLGDEDDDVSLTVTPFVHSYLAVLKQMPSLSAQQKGNLEGLLHVIIRKMKYDDSHNFDREGEDEVMFLEYRKNVKILFDNIAQLDSNLVMVMAHNVLNSTLGTLNEAKFMDVEVAVRLLYLLGEAISGQQLYSDNSKFSALQQMMTLLVTSHLSHYNHSAVSQLFFETVVRYDRFFSTQPQHIPTVLVAFLDDRGLRNPNGIVRSRCCYLFSRFIKSHKANMESYVDDVLNRLEGLLVIDPENGHQHFLTADEKLFLYESGGILITCSGASQEKQLLYMKNLMSPIIVKFDSLLLKMMSGLDEQSSCACAQSLYRLMAFASRASKAFPSQQALKQSGCTACFTEALPIFLRALTVPVHRDVIHSGVRQFLHRMVICLGEGVLQFVPEAVTHLLEDSSARDIQEFIPLINQIILRFKHLIVPFLSKVFMAIVNRIFVVLSNPAASQDVQAAKEKETLRRSYFLFIASVVTNEVTAVLTNQDPQHIQQVMMTLIEGCVDCPDPVAQKICFNVLRKLVEIWGGNNGDSGFRDFIYDSIVPACFMAPMKPTFNLNDAQTCLALQEIGHTQQVILQKQGGEYVNFLQSQYLPKLNLAPELIQEYTHAVQHADMKAFKNYVKVFFTKLRS